MIGFLIFIPFLVIDLIVASVLMSLGMMMLSPVLVGLALFLTLFVMAPTLDRVHAEAYQPFTQGEISFEQAAPPACPAPCAAARAR